MKKFFSIATVLLFIFNFALLPAVRAENKTIYADSTYTDETVVSLGFVGWYNWKDAQGLVHTSQTSFYWQELKSGEFIDWDAVDEAYNKWIADGGLAPDRANGWKTSGSEPLRFADYAKIGHIDFTRNQLEVYHLSFYADPGYVK